MKNLLGYDLSSNYNIENMASEIKERNHCNDYTLLNELLAKCITEDSLKKDAAALCQFVYACDPNRSGNDKIYPTCSGGWKPYYMASQKSPYAKNMINCLRLFAEKERNKNLIQSYMDVRNETILNKIGYNGIFGIFKKDISIENRLANRISGFFSMIFYRKCESSQYDIAYVTAGTTGNMKNIYDLLVDNVTTNLLQGLIGVSPQYTRSIQNAKILAKFCECNTSIRNLYFFGHSLGGGMAAANALATGHRAIIFNHAGLNIWRKIYGRIKNNNSMIVSYHTKNDFLTTETRQGWFLVNPLLSVFCSSALDGDRVLLGGGGHDLVGILEKYCGLYPINVSNIDYSKGF